MKVTFNRLTFNRDMDREERIEDSRFYHVYNRGNNRERIFGDASDYEAFLKKIDLRMARYSVAVPIYCLMPNHFHMIAMQNPGGNLSDFMGALATSAAKRYNLKYGHIGHVFQGPFRYKPFPDDALWDVASYIHLNPVRAGLAKEPDEWRFSNFAQMKVAQMKSTRRLSEVEGNLYPSARIPYGTATLSMCENS